MYRCRREWFEMYEDKRIENVLWWENWEEKNCWAGKTWVETPEEVEDVFWEYNEVLPLDNSVCMMCIKELLQFCRKVKVYYLFMYLHTAEIESIRQ